MVLMSGEGRPPREGLLTIGIRTLVRPFARVNTTMPGERAGVTERLQTCKYIDISQQSSPSYLSTPLALMRLLASVHSLMHSEG